MKPMKTFFNPWPAALLAALLGVDTTLHAQGSLTPPGAPVPTMKTLDQVQPRTPVDATHTPGDAGSLFKITNAGSYYLTGNITGVSSQHGIVIATPNVTLDLNGFSLIGVPGSLIGICATNAIGTATGLRIRNGVISGWGLYGIATLVPPSNNAGAPGANFSRLSLLTNCTANAGVLAGLAASGAVVSDCVAQGNLNSYGILAYGSHVSRCAATGGNDQGFGMFAGTTLENSVSSGNAYGVDAGDSTVSGCTIYNNSADGIYVRNNCRLVGNLINGSGFVGIYVQGNIGRNLVDGYTVVNNVGAGITLTNAQPGNLVIRNTARGNGTNYLMGTGNSFGPIVNVSGVGDISSNTNASQPWANFSF
jgi:parallel beta-helix repeat protein